jgi:hypothetical protein
MTVRGPVEAAFVRLERWACPQNLRTLLIYAQHRRILDCRKAVVADQRAGRKADLCRKNTCWDRPGLVEVDIAAAWVVTASPASEGRVNSY